jgi:hypothetical protein
MTQAVGVKKKRSPWLWFGCGCGCFVLIVLISLAVLMVWATRRMANFASDMADPEKMRERVYEVLDSSEIPDGYYPLVGLKIPLVLQFAVISDAPHDADEGERTSMFLYLDGASWMKSGFSETWYDDVAQSTSGNLDVDVGAPLSSGDLTVGDLDVQYTSHRGSVRIEDNRLSGIVTAMVFECPQDSRARFGLWLVPEREAEAGGDPSALPHDAATIERFLGTMSLCP